MPFICHPMVENIVPSHFQNHSPVAFCGPVRPSSDSPNQLRCLSCSVAAGENGAIRTTHAVILGGIGAPPPRSSIAPSLSQLWPRPRGLLSFARIRDAAFARIRAAPIHDAAFAYIRATAAVALATSAVDLASPASTTPRAQLRVRSRSASPSAASVRFMLLVRNGTSTTQQVSYVHIPHFILVFVCT